MREILLWLKTEENGQGSLEYGLILIFVSIVAIAALGVLGSTLLAKFTSSGNSIP